jgi:hypothetical protein
MVGSTRIEKQNVIFHAFSPESIGVWVGIGVEKTKSDSDSDPDREFSGH